jgi:site-specific recombinase XerD
MNLDGFISHLRTRSYSGGTIVAYRSELQQFQQYLREAKLRVNQIKPIHVEKYLQWRDPKAEQQSATTRRRLAALSSFYDFLAVMSNGHIRNPVRPLRRPRRQPPRPKPLDEKQVAVLAEGIDSARDAAIIGLLLHSGLRVSELCSLNRNSIAIEHLDANLGGKVVGVGRVLGKGRKEREFLVNRPTLKLVHEYLLKRGSDDIDALFLSNRKRRINPRTIQHMLRTWCKRLNLPPLHPHQLRSTFGTRLNRVGVPTLEISKLLGHASLDTTMMYVKPDARRIRTEYFAAHEKLNP